MLSLARRLEEGGVLSCAAVSPAAQPFLAVVLHQLCPHRPLTVVTDGVRTQETFAQDLETWLHVAGCQLPVPSASTCNLKLGAGKPLFYPAWDVLPHEDRLPHADIISDRLETLIALTPHAPPLTAQNSRGAPRAPLIVTTVVALLQRTFPLDALARRTRSLRRGDRSDPLDLVEWLEAQGYEPEAQVTQKGEIALRGGILDVYPLSSPWPVRLEFFGDELESLRQFDPATQVSREQIETVVLPPAGELGLLKREAESEVRSQAPETELLATLIDYLPRGAIFLLCEPDALEEAAADYARQVPEADPFVISWERTRAEMVQRATTLLEVAEGEMTGAARAESRGATETAAPNEASLPLPPALALPENGHSIPREEDAKAAGPPALSPPAQNPLSALGSLSFASLDAFRPLAERAPQPPVAEAQRREFFAQLHRWLRQGYAVHVFCNNDGERQRFGEIWAELGFRRESGGEDRGPERDEETPALDPRLSTHLGTLARGFLCDDAKIVVVTDAEIFGRYKVPRPRRLKSAHALATRSALDIDFTDLEEGDLVVHLQHGIGRFLGLHVMPPGSGRKGLPGLNDVPASARDGGEECLVLEYAPGDPAQPPPKLYVPVTEAHLVSKYIGAGKARPPLHTLGGTRWVKAKAQAERAVRDIAAELLALQAARESQPGLAFAADTPWQREFESAFLFEETPDQMRAIVEAKSDMEKPKPMDRLICGDVGFGKTEVAIRAAFKAVMSGKQVAVLVPTTVLAQQHANTFRDRMADYPVRIELLSRFRTRREQQRVVRDLAGGAVDIVIGTHRLLQDDIVFKDLGLVVIDEEQRFGVLHKEQFKMLRKLVDVLTLTATPIPRTLYLALTGARDMSTIETPPHDRLPIETIVTPYDERVIRDAIQRELNRGGQVYFLHNRVMTIDLMADRLRQLLPQARIVVGHGQMHSDELEEVMTAFVNGAADVLLSTTIIESGLDIPNANTIIIDRADRFGLSDLYQLRGRVGRYKHQAYAYLLLPRHARLLADVRKRISAIKQYATLGSGFKVAMRDLEIRGAGNLLGAEQSGHITAVGFELYCQLLQQSVAALKGEKVKPRVEVTVRLDFLELNPAEEGSRASGVGGRASEPESGDQRAPRAARRGASAGLPFRYIADSRQRIEIYRKLAQATERAALPSLKGELRDRFGPAPPEVELLLLVAELKILASERGIAVIEVKEDRLMLTRGGDYVMLGGKFPRLTRPSAPARLKEIRRLLLAL